MTQRSAGQFKNRDRFIEIGLAIAYFRKLKGMTQQQLADLAMVSRSHITSIEAPNIARSFSLEILFNIADALEIEATDLLNFPVNTKKVVSKD